MHMLSGWFPTVPNTGGALWNKMSRCAHGDTTTTPHRYNEHTHTHTHTDTHILTQTAFIDSVWGLFCFPPKLWKESALLCQGYVCNTQHPRSFVFRLLDRTIFVCPCWCPPPSPSPSPSVPSSRSCSSMCLCEVFSCDDENFSLPEPL